MTNSSKSETIFDEEHFASLLEISNNPHLIKQLSEDQLQNLSVLLRQFTIETVKKTGGHLGAGLGVVELTIALHHVFDTPKDRLIWDIGHQAYPHKILTGRMNQMSGIRKKNGISGFLRRDESEFDVFGAGHSSTSISAALGMAVARDCSDEKKEIVAVIGDGAISAGMAYEAMNNAGATNSRLIVVLNDNDMSIAPATGAMSQYLSNVLASKSYLKIRSKTKELLEKVPQALKNAAKNIEKISKTIANPSNLFEDLGFYYFGAFDGHDLPKLIKVFQNIKENKAISRPILIHVKTEKGRGFIPSEGAAMKKAEKENFHAIGKISSNEIKVQNIPTYTSVFSSTIEALASQDKKVFAITAAMPSGTGLTKFAEKFPKQFADVGIAEQHAVTFAAGLATEGVKPFVAIYSTFLQRAYDQVIHDVAIQNLPVRFVIDRAGYVGADGATHAGSFDLAFLGAIPNLNIMSPSDESELNAMLKLMYEINDAPSAVRFPRGEANGVAIDDALQIALGEGKFVQQGAKIAFVSLGARLKMVQSAAKILESNHGVKATIFDARFLKPLDENNLTKIAKNHDVIITIEEGSVGGFASHVSAFFAKSGLLSKVLFKQITYPDVFFEHATQDELHEAAKMDVDSIVETAMESLN